MTSRRGVNELLEQHFDTAFTAPDGIKKLRELILTLAIQGKLVEQDPDDPPASELLKAIEAEKQHLVKGGKIKQPKPLSPIKLEEVPYELPLGWEWVKLRNIGLVGSSSRVHQRDWKNDGVPFYRAREIVKLSSFDFVENELFISEKHYQSLAKDGLIPETGDLMITGVGTIGVPYIVKETDRFYFKDASVLIFKNLYLLNASFLFSFFRSPFWIEQIHDGSMGTTVHTLTIGKANEILTPLPPLPEQHRIVAKIDQLMAKCDELEKLRKERQEKRLTVHAAAIKQLLDNSPSFPRGRESSRTEELDHRSPSARGQACGEDEKELEGDGGTVSGWGFIQQHFGELYTVKENVTELRKAILQLAVMGRLVPQDPNDPPASELLKAIEAEKQQLVKDGKIKQHKPLQPIKPEEVPYELPEGWEWVKFEEIVDISSGITKGRKFADQKLISIPYLRVANVQRGYLDLKKIKEIEIPVEEVKKYQLINGDLLITEGGDWDKVGRTCIWMDEIPHCGHQNHVFRARKILIYQNERWLEKYLNSPMSRDYFANASKQTTNLASINMSQLRRCPIPLPPLPEQHRIAAKIDQLMALCVTLEQQIDAATGKQTGLLDAVMAQV